MDDMEKEKELQDEEVSGREEETAERREASLLSVLSPRKAATSPNR